MQGAKHRPFGTGNRKSCSLAAGVSNGTPFAYLLAWLCKKKLIASWKSPGAGARSRRQGAQRRIGAVRHHAKSTLDGHHAAARCSEEAVQTRGGSPRGRKSKKYHFTLKREELEVGNYRLRVLVCPHTLQAAQPMAPLLEAGRRGHPVCVSPQSPLSPGGTGNL